MQECKTKGADCTAIIKKFLDYSNQNRAIIVKNCTGGGVRCSTYQDIIAANTTESALNSIKDPDVRRIVATVNTADLIFLDKEVGTLSKIGNAVLDPVLVGTLLLGKGSGSATSLKNVAKTSTLSAGSNMLYDVASQWAMNGEIDYRDLITAGVIGGLTGISSPNAGSNVKSANNIKQQNPYGVPVPDKVIAANGLTYKSHIKHAGRGVAARPGHLASVEPKNSLELFNSSIPTTNQNSNLRYAYDGHYVHQFSLSNGVYHWSGIKGKIDINQVPIDVRRKLGVNIKKLK